MKKKFITLAKSLYLTVVFYLMPRAAYAQPPRIDGLVDVFNNVLLVAFPIGALIAVIMIVYAGYIWMASAGDPGKIKQAQGTITWAILGLVFIAIFRMILEIVFNFLES